jgi:hypothetical protein
VDRLLSFNCLAKTGARRGVEWTASARLGKRRRQIVRRDDAKSAAFVEKEIAKFGPTEPHCVCQHGFKYRPQRAGRARDYAQHISGSGLLLERFAQLVEQPRVLDGDDGLVREVRKQSDCCSVKGRTSWR